MAEILTIPTRVTDLILSITGIPMGTSGSFIMLPGGTVSLTCTLPNNLFNSSRDRDKFPGPYMKSL